MADFKYAKDLFFDEALDFGIQEVVYFLEQKIREITPRDLERLPNNINRKDGKKPVRTRGRGVVNINGDWYPGITGNLKRSIGHERVSDFFFLIGVKKGPATKYARAQEFGTVHIPPRSFIRKGIFDNIKEANRIFFKSVKEKLGKI